MNKQEMQSVIDAAAAAMRAQILRNAARHHRDAAARNPLNATHHLARAAELELKAATPRA